MLQLAKFFGLLLVIIGLGSILFIFNLFIFTSNLSKIFLDLIFNYDYLLNAEYLFLIPALLIISSKH